MKKGITLAIFITALICYIFASWFVRKYERENFKLKIENEKLKTSIKLSDEQNKIINSIAKYKGIKQHLISNRHKLENGEEPTIRRVPLNMYGLYFYDWALKHPIAAYKNRYDIAYPIADVFNSFVYQEYGHYHNKHGQLKKQKHYGVDILCFRDYSVLPAKVGRVEKVGYHKYYGNYIILQHRGFKTFYAHLEKILVENNQHVEAWDTIGIMGSSGNSKGVHLHFAVIDKGKFVNPFLNSTYDIPVSNRKTKQFIY